MKRFALSVTLAAAMALASHSAARAEWKPSGPIKMMIAFAAGGGADTQARLIGEELGKRKGWKFIYENITGKGGSNLAAALKGAKPDGLTLGIAVVETVAYNPLVSRKSTYTAADFDYIVTTAPTQMGLVVRADKGWKSLDDLAKAAKSGKRISIAIMSPRLGDAAYVIAKKYGIKFNRVKVKGGKGSLNAIVAGDVDVGFVAGIHAKGVKAGDLLNLASAEGERLTMSPNAPTMRELGMPFDFGATFLMMAPKGLPKDARAAIAAAVAELLKDPNSKAAKFINRAFGKPPLHSGAALDKFIADNLQLNKNLLATLK